MILLGTKIFIQEINRSKKMDVEFKNLKICVIGLGYVGLPLCIELSKHFDTIGFDINDIRVSELSLHRDSTLEISEETLIKSTARYFNCLSACADCNVYIITVPTPINNQRLPDFDPLIKATQNVSKYLDTGNLIVYESTVYPGATRAVCLPIVEEVSGLKLNESIYLAYSPERINPGDTENSLVNTNKLVGASNEKTLKLVSEIYEKIMVKGVIHKVASIEIAEAAKIIENTQRDVNIALMNEFSEILGKLNIPTKDVLAAASTKWNFHNYYPGLVGGHCIGVDPYYLINCAHEVGLKPRLISAARYVNEGVVERIVNEFVKKYLQENIENREVLVVGGTFKEDCPDIRNSKTLDVIQRLSELGFKVSLYDPLISHEIGEKLPYDLLKQLPTKNIWGGVILSVLHSEEREHIEKIVTNYNLKSTVFFDLKSNFEHLQSDFSL